MYGRCGSREMYVNSVNLHRLVILSQHPPHLVGLLFCDERLQPFNPHEIVIAKLEPRDNRLSRCQPQAHFLTATKILPH